MIYPYQKLLPLEYENLESNNPSLTENVQTLGTLHSVLCKGLDFTSKNQFPIVLPSFRQPPEYICSLHRLRRKPESVLQNICGHFFTSDTNIEPFWNHPFRNLQFLKKLDCIISTDFSIYTNMVFYLNVELFSQQTNVGILSTKRYTTHSGSFMGRPPKY